VAFASKYSAGSSREKSKNYRSTMEDDMDFGMNEEFLKQMIVIYIDTPLLDQCRRG
jgi:hypothetical protein